MGEITLLNCDCMSFMKGCADRQFDLAIVDPPYGIAMSRTKHHQPATKNKITNYKPKEWDNNTPDINYFNELSRISKKQMIWGGNYFSDYLKSSKDWVIWDKEQPEDMHFSQAELCWNNIGHGIRIFKRSISRDQNRVSNGSPSAYGYIRIHPTQKPVALYKWLLTKYAKAGDKILDTHLGSMSSVIACADYGYDITGCEIDCEYFAAGVKRVKNHLAQMSLFRDIPTLKTA